MKIRQHVAMWPLDAPLKKYLRTPLIEDINMERGTPYDLFYKQTPVVKAWSFINKLSSSSFARSV